MNDSRKQRQFSSPMRDANSAFLPSGERAAADDRPVRVAFVLLEHFSMMAFTAAVDALVTSNLVRTAALFDFRTYGLDNATVKSDLNIDISTSGTLEQLQTEPPKESPEILIVCGGFRCELDEYSTLSQKLKQAERAGAVVGSLWNGAVALAQAGLLDGRSCALHPDNHAYLGEAFPRVRIAEQMWVVEDQRATSAGPSSALEMMLALIEQLQDKGTVRAVREILSCDQVSSGRTAALAQPGDDANYPEPLKELLQVMTSNIEEPLTIEELASCTGLSRRRIERLFQTHLDTSPSRYYLELRVTHARRLLLQSGQSIANIAVACGFVSSTHFSHCFKDYFGLSPSQYRSDRQS